MRRSLFMEFDANFRNISIEVFDKSEKNREEWYTDQESNKTKEVFREDKDDECDKDREINIG
jgi:hypothetical protein